LGFGSDPSGAQFQAGQIAQGGANQALQGAGMSAAALAQLIAELNRKPAATTGGGVPSYAPRY
jgi:hypothetical protein